MIHVGWGGVHMIQHMIHYMIHVSSTWGRLHTWYTHDTCVVHYMIHVSSTSTWYCIMSVSQIVSSVDTFFLLEIHWYKCIMCIMCVLQQARDDTYMIQTWYCIILTRWYMYQQMIRWYTMIHDDTVSSSAVSDFRDLIHYLIHYMIHDDTRTKDDTRWYTRDTEMILYQIGK